ncbi:MAG: Cys-tRNA(Pro) deacylase [Candidatus Fimenecus sp.]
MSKKETKTNVVRILEKLNAEFLIHTYDIPDNDFDGEKIAKTLNQNKYQVFKTLITKGKSGTFYIFDIPVCKKLDMKKAAESVNEKSIEIVSPKSLFKLTGYIRGGCSPIGTKRNFKTTFDKSALNFETIFISGGKSGIQIELAPKWINKAILPNYADITIN